MGDLRYGSLVCMNEIKPKFPPKVQAIWDDCGTNVTSMEAEQGAKEIEFFVESLIESIELSLVYRDRGETIEQALVREGYLNYERC